MSIVTFTTLMANRFEITVSSPFLAVMNAYAMPAKSWAGTIVAMLPSNEIFIPSCS